MGKTKSKDSEVKGTGSAEADGALEELTKFTGGKTLKFDEDRQIVYGVVYEPSVIDTQGEFAGRGAIMDAAHAFMINGATVKLDHAEETSSVVIVENYVAPVDFVLGGEIVREGSWMMAVKIFDPEIWENVLTGQYGGFSFGARVVRQPESDYDAQD